MIILMTKNVRKIPEYRAFFKRHAQTLRVEEPTEDKEILSTWLSGKSVRAIVADESDVYLPNGNLVHLPYQGAAQNICRLHAWVMEDGVLKRRSYIRSITGEFNSANLCPEDPTIFDWDSAFTPHQGIPLHNAALVGLKNSAREQCLSAFVEEYLRHAPKVPRFTPVKPEGIVDWKTDARLLLANPLYHHLPAELENALAFVVNQGIFFRAAHSRRDGNYWLPGLNGGLPYVPKDDSIHEAVYAFHDVMHQLMPDLIFDGVDTKLHRQTYIIYRMMSEAVSLALADMRFAASLETRDTTGYDFDKRLILPLYQTMQGAEIATRELLHRMVRYVTLGEIASFPFTTPAWTAFERKYHRFFIGDFQWTRMNWQNLFGRKKALEQFVQLITPRALRAQNLWLVSDVVNELDAPYLSLPKLVDALFDLVMKKRLEPALNYPEEPSLELSRSNGFRRWLTGQCALFARYEPIIGIPPLGYELIARVQSDELFNSNEMEVIRTRFRTYIKELAASGIISDDDAFVFQDVFPLFDPFFLKDYDTGAQEFTSLTEASITALS